MAPSLAVYVMTCSVTVYVLLLLCISFYFCIYKPIVLMVCGFHCFRFLSCFMFIHVPPCSCLYLSGSCAFRLCVCLCVPGLFLCVSVCD